MPSPTLQLYFDFSGYSDMAIGLSRLFNVDLPLNFYSPYKATSIIEFWRRWHISLSRFLRDYLYIPLGGNRTGPWRRYVNLMITMVLGGLCARRCLDLHHLGCCARALSVGQSYLGDVAQAFPLGSAAGAGGVGIDVFLCCRGMGFFFRSPDGESAFTMLGRMIGTGELAREGCSRPIG